MDTFDCLVLVAQARLDRREIDAAISLSHYVFQGIANDRCHPPFWPIRKAASPGLCKGGGTRHYRILLSCLLGVERQITHLICARLKYDLYDFFRGGALGLLYKRKKGSRPKTPPEKVI